MNNLGLDFFYNNVSAEEFEKMLCDISYKNNTLFFTLYENAPEKLKPSLEEENYFVSLLCSRVEELAEKEFNDWFFEKNLKKFYDVYEVRTLIEKKPENAKLKELLEDQDKPKNTAELLSALWYNKEKNIDKYHNLIDLHKKKLIDINKKQLTYQSPIGSLLFQWMDKLDYNEKIKLAQELHLDIIKIACNSQRNLRIEIQEISLQDLKNIWDKMPNTDTRYKLSKTDRNLFAYVNVNTGFWDKLFDILDANNHHEKNEKAQFMFDNILNYFENKLKVKKDQIKINLMELMRYPEKEDLQFFLGNLLEKLDRDGGHPDKFKEKIKQHNEDFFGLINPMYSNLQKSLEEKSSTKKMKI